MEQPEPKSVDEIITKINIIMPLTPYCFVLYKIAIHTTKVCWLPVNVKRKTKLYWADNKQCLILELFKVEATNPCQTPFYLLDVIAYKDWS